MNQKEYDQEIANQIACKDLRYLSMQHTPRAFTQLPEEQKPIMMGFEWETDVHNREKWDGILSKDILTSPIKDFVNFRPGGCWMELVSIPASMKFLRKMMTDMFFKHGWEKEFKVEGLGGSNTNGIHIHISKDAFDVETLKRFIFFVSSPFNRKFMEDIGGRKIQKNAPWCRPSIFNFKTKGRGKNRFISEAEINVDKGTLKLKRPSGYADTKYFPTGKSVAVNTDTGYNTVEFRIFTSVDTQQKFLKNLEFTEALVQFVRENTDIPQMNVRAFISYVRKNWMKYPNLARDEAIIKRIIKTPKHVLIKTA